MLALPPYTSGSPETLTLDLTVLAVKSNLLDNKLLPAAEERAWTEYVRRHSSASQPWTTCV